MKTKLLHLAFLGLSCTAYADTATPTPPAPHNANGYWQTIDDTTGKPKGVVAIITQNNLTTGTVMGGYPVNGTVPHDYCSKCPSPFTNKPVTGLQILWGFHYDAHDKAYEGGRILDPDSGDIYHAMLTPENDGQQLKVRGYIGIPLIGRTQVWNRLTTQEYQKFLKTYYPNETISGS